MKSWADRIRDFGAPIYVTLQHEPEAATKTSLGHVGRLHRGMARVGGRAARRGRDERED